MSLSSASFRERFQAFYDPVKFPDSRLDAALGRAQLWLDIPDSDADGGEPHYLLAAHMLDLDEQLKAGSVPFGAIASASVGSVSVGMQVPAVSTAWQAWLAGTSYGQQLWAWLSLKSESG